jgi:hypothetical protein
MKSDALYFEKILCFPALSISSIWSGFNDFDSRILRKSRAISDVSGSSKTVRELPEKFSFCARDKI